MRIFLTGGTGFIGSNFINHAHDAGYEIVAQRRSHHSSPKVNLKKQPNWLEKPLRSLTPEDFAECSQLVHLAAYSANLPYDTLENCLIQNVMDPLAMFRAAIAAGIKRFIVAGSYFEYGLSSERYEFIPTTAALEPQATYPTSKAAGSVVFQALAHEQNLELLILRICQVYGEGEADCRFWPSLRKAALAGNDFTMSAGHQVRDFINVSAVAAGFVKALDRTDLAPGQPVIENLGSGTPRRLIDFAQAEWERFGATGKIVPGAVPMRPNEVMRFVPEMPPAPGPSPDSRQPSA
jgi:nucleoside-diphosphate-sugar epimerase